jgi:orotate phosphoribosyltransferase
VIAYAHHSLHWDIQALLVRKKAKDHGASQGRATEGQLANMNQKVWLVEDVVSTGGSAIVALEHLRAEGYPLGGFLCLVDREMGGVEALKAQFDIPVITLTKLSELF